MKRAMRPVHLDAGLFGCLGVGVPFANTAAPLFPRRQVICATGDGAFGVNAMEVDTAMRHGCAAVFVVSNNGPGTRPEGEQAMLPEQPQPENGPFCRCSSENGESVAW